MGKDTSKTAVEDEDMKVNIKSNKKLFDQLNRLSIRFSKLNNIVQNDAEIGDSDVHEWGRVYRKLMRDIDDWNSEVKAYLMSEIRTESLKKIKGARQ